MQVYVHELHKYQYTNTLLSHTTNDNYMANVHNIINIYYAMDARCVQLVTLQILRVGIHPVMQGCSLGQAADLISDIYLVD